MSVEVDPLEVLAHLHDMGYIHVSREKLMAFITDLKKLIKYDSRTCNCSNSCFSEELETTKDSYNSVNSQDHSAASFSYGNDEASRVSQLVDFPANVKEQSAGKPHRKIKKEPNAPAKKLVQSRSLHSARARSAFIKPWQFQGQVVPHRSDPVALYHKYQSLWRQQKLPGDNHHDTLRWNIREKMMGCDPIPQPILRSTSVDKVHRYNGNYR